jgi:flagellar biosynthetic protein FliP
VSAVPATRTRIVLAAAGVLGAGGLALGAAPAAAAARPTVAVAGFEGSVPAGPRAPTSPTAPTRPGGTPDSDVTLNVPGQPSQVVTIILLVTVLGIAPAVLLMCTSFTKIVVVLSLTRTALGTPTIPPNQVMVGLALFLSLFVMGPVLTQMNDTGIQPYLNGTKTSAAAYHDASGPLRGFMLKHTRPEELALMSKAANQALPRDRTAVDIKTLIPAFVLSELRAAFIIGFVIFVPFLVIDIVVSAVLMSLGMVMLPPSLVSLPFKLLLFVLVDGWSLIVTTLLGSYR